MKSKMHKIADAQFISRMLLLSFSFAANLNMVKTVGAIDKALGARKSRAPGDQARARLR